jgi:hypothetical protein
MNLTNALKASGTAAILAVCVLAAQFSQAQTTAPAAATPTESSPLTPAPAVAPTQPIVHNWKLTKLDGKINVVVNSDGTYIFSGGFKDKKPLHDWDITLALKSSLGEVILFHYEGDASNGIEFSKTGQSDILKDNFASFAKNHQTAWNYVFHLSAEGRAKQYEAEEKKKEEIKKAKEEAEKRHEEKVAAETRKELEQEQQAEARARAQQQQSSSSSVGSTVGTVLKTVGSVVGAILCFL